MSDVTIYTLVPSTSRGRYALDDPLHGQDLTSGQSLALVLGGRWIDDSIEYASCLYANEHMPQAVYSGYYFLASDGNVCGLCEGRESLRKVTGGDR